MPSKAPKAYPVHLTSQFLEQQNDINRAGVNFLKTDLETALTFSSMALNTTNSLKKRRLTGEARKAFDTIVHLMNKVKLTQSDRHFIDENLRRLKQDLRTLGVVF